MTESEAGVTKLPNSEINEHRAVTVQTGGIGEGEEMVFESFTSTSGAGINNTFHTAKPSRGMCLGLEEATPLGMSSLSLPGPGNI